MLPGQIRPMPPGYAAISNGLVGYWGLDPDCVLPGGMTADLSANQNPGTLISSPTYVQGQVGTALNFNGSSSYVDLGTPSALNLTTAFSFAAWINPAGLPTSAGTYNYIFSHGYDGTNTQFDFSLQNDGSTGNAPGLQIGSYQNPSNHNVFWSYGSSIAIGVWSHVAGTYDGANWAVYFNGQQVATKHDPVVIATVAAHVTIGGRIVSGAPLNFFNGILDDVIAWNRALDPPEIIALYQAGLSGRRDDVLGVHARDLQIAALAAISPAFLGWTSDGPISMPRGRMVAA